MYTVTVPDPKVRIYHRGWECMIRINWQSYFWNETSQLFKTTWAIGWPWKAVSIHTDGACLVPTFIHAKWCVYLPAVREHNAPTSGRKGDKPVILDKYSLYQRKQRQSVWKLQQVECFCSKAERKVSQKSRTSTNVESSNRLASEFFLSPDDS